MATAFHSDMCPLVLGGVHVNTTEATSRNAPGPANGT